MDTVVVTMALAQPDECLACHTKANPIDTQVDLDHFMGME